MRQYQQNICYVMDGSVPVARCVCEEDAQAIVERLNNLADALDAERKARREAEEAMLAIVENEPEFPDDPPAILMDAFGNLAAARGTEGAVVELMRLSVRETKWCIAEKIRSLARAAGEGKAEPKPEPRDPRACPTCGSLSTFNGACMKCHEDYAMGGG